ncbi:MAG: hypothetical protein ACKOXF_12540 [Chitinophagaceae bacterium]
MKSIRLTGIALFTLLCLLAAYWYKERVLYIDSAYYAFNLFNNGYPAAEHNRYALFLYQLIPWGMFEIGASVPLTLRVYSVCHILLHGIAFLMLFRMKQPLLAALLLIMQIIGYRECFFLSVNETALAISATCLLAAWLNFRQIAQKWAFWDILISVTCILIALYSHPMSMILLPFILGFHFIRNNQNAIVKKQTLWVGLTLTVLALTKKFLSSGSGYEDDLYAQLNNTWHILSNLKDIYSFKFFTGEFKLQGGFFKIYWIPVLLMILCIYLMAQKKLWMQLTYYVLCSVGFWLLIIVFFNRGDGTIFMEKNFTPWIFVALYPLTFLITLQETKIHWPLITGIAVIYLVSFNGIFQVKDMYQKRLYLMDQLITQKAEGHSKLLIQDSTVNHEEWLGIWALPYETLLLSKVKGIPEVSARIYKNDSTINKELHRKDIFLGADFIPVLPASYLLNKSVFQLKDETYYTIEKP